MAQNYQDSIQSTRTKWTIDFEVSLETRTPKETILIIQTKSKEILVMSITSQEFSYTTIILFCIVAFGNINKTAGKTKLTKVLPLLKEQSVRYQLLSPSARTRRISRQRKHFNARTLVGGINVYSESNRSPLEK